MDEAEDTVRLSGNSNDEPLPVDIRVFLEQEDPAQASRAEIAFGPVNRLTTAWRAELPCAGFTKGPALASGVEIRMEPFTDHRTRTVEIG